MKPVAVLCFPGTQCDQDVVKALKLLNRSVEKIWYTDHFFPKDYSAFILPGGFSYGDYLRAGALARTRRLCRTFKRRHRWANLF